MNLAELPIKYPLSPPTQKYFFKTFSGMKDLITQTVGRRMGIQLLEKDVADICQIFFCLGNDIEPTSDERFNFGIDLVKRDFSESLGIFRKDLVSIVRKSNHKGVPQDHLIEYLAFYYEDVHKKIFTIEPVVFSMLSENKKD